MRLNNNWLLLGFCLGNSLIVSYSYQTTAIAQELPAKYSRSRLVNNSPLEKSIDLKQNINPIGNKSSSQQLAGTWSVTSVNDSGGETTSTIMYSPDGTYIYLVTFDNGDWYIRTTGTWELQGNTLYERYETGESIEGSVKFVSNDEFVYRGENGETKWQRVEINPNLSKDQLVGTWSIDVQQRVGDSFIDNFNEKSNAQLIELNSDGTFRYKSIDAGIIGLSDIVTRTASGTWTYINSGYADGLLVLNDSEGNLFSFSSINWNEDGTFININRSNFDREQNNYKSGRIEEFERSDLVIDQTF